MKSTTVVFSIVTILLVVGCSQNTPPQPYIVTPLPSTNEVPSKLLAEFGSMLNPPSQPRMTSLVGVLNQEQLDKVMAAIPQPLPQTNDLSVVVAAETNGTRDLKISGPKLNGKDMDTFITVYPTQTVVMTSSAGSPNGQYRIFLVSPK